MEIVSEACCHKYMPQTVLFYVRSHIFFEIIIMIKFVWCMAVYKAFSQINSFNPDGNPDR